MRERSLFHTGRANNPVLKLLRWGRHYKIPYTVNNVPYPPINLKILKMLLGEVDPSHYL